MATAHFTDAELNCPHCGDTRLSLEFLRELERLRTMFGKPMLVTSGYRCPEYNDTVSSTGMGGPHTVGAVDVVIAGGRAFELVGMAINLGWRGIGVKQHGPWNNRFIHLDRLNSLTEVRPRPRVWSYA